MKNTAKTTKTKVLILLVILFGSTAFATFTFSANVDTNKPFHPLQQISKSTTNLQTADDNTNQIIDEADYATTAGNADTLDGYHAQDIIQSQKQKLECIIVTNAKAHYYEVSNCPSGYAVTGGGVETIVEKSITVSRAFAPTGSNSASGWQCSTSTGQPFSIICHAVCCRLSP